MFLREHEQKSELQNRVAAELEERLRAKPSIEYTDAPDPSVVAGSHQTRKAGMIIAILLFVLAMSVVALAVKLSL